MAKHLVTMLIGRIVEAGTQEEANRKAVIPFRHGIVPNIVGVSLCGTRPATSADDDGSIQKAIDAAATRIQIEK